MALLQTKRPLVTIHDEEGLSSRFRVSMLSRAVESNVKTLSFLPFCLLLSLSCFLSRFLICEHVVVECAPLFGMHIIFTTISSSRSIRPYFPLICISSFYTIYLWSLVALQLIVLPLGSLLAWVMVL